MIRSVGSVAPSDIPVIETARLRLRPYRLSDLDRAADMWSDHKVIRYIGGVTRSRAEVFATFQRMIGSWALLGYGYWVVADKQSDVFVGEIGFLEALRIINPAFAGTPEAGWGLMPEVWGKGVAGEALAAVLDWADVRFSETVCIIDPPNTASVRVAERAGYVLRSETEYKDAPCNIYERFA